MKGIKDPDALSAFLQLQGFAQGGMISEPSYLVSMRTNKLWGTVAEHGTERVLSAAQTNLERAREDLAVSIGEFHAHINWSGSAGSPEDRKRLAEDLHIEFLRKMADTMRRQGMIR